MKSTWEWTGNQWVNRLPANPRTGLTPTELTPTELTPTELTPTGFGALAHHDGALARCFADREDPDCNASSGCSPVEACLGGSGEDADRVVGCVDPNCGGARCGTCLTCISGSCEYAWSYPRMNQPGKGRTNEEHLVLAVLSVLCVLVVGSACGGGEGTQDNHNNHILNNNWNTNTNANSNANANTNDNTSAGNPGEPCFPDNTCNTGYTCHQGTCYDAGDQGEDCLPDDTCNEDLSCYQGTCMLAGNEGEPCFPDLSCNEGFACANESVQSSQECRVAIQARVVNCLASGGQSVDMKVVVGMVEFPEIASMYSTPCQAIPTGGVGITMYIDGEWYEDAFMEIGTDEPEIYIQPSSTAFYMYVAGCTDQLQCQ